MNKDISNIGKIFFKSFYLYIYIFNQEFSKILFSLGPDNAAVSCSDCFRIIYLYILKFNLKYAASSEKSFKFNKKIHKF